LYKFLSESTETYNEDVKNINNMIYDKKKSISESDLDEAERELELFQNKKNRLKPEIDRL